MHPVAPRLRPRQILRHARPGRPRAAGAARRRSPFAAANAWRWRALGRRQEHAAALALRQLPPARGLDPRAPRRRLGRSGAAEPRSPRRAPPHLGFVSQFLRVIPRVAAVDVVAEPLVRLGWTPRGAPRAEFLLEPARHPGAAVGAAAGDLLRRRAAAGQHRALADRRLSRSCCSTSRPPRSTPPIARRRRADRRSAATRGAAIVGIFHDAAVRDALATRIHDVAVPGTAEPHDTETIFTNARIVTADAEFDGTVVVRDGQIVEVATGRSQRAPAPSISAATI